jgi:O-antigen polymerase
MTAIVLCGSGVAVISTGVVWTLLLTVCARDRRSRLWGALPVLVLAGGIVWLVMTRVLHSGTGMTLPFLLRQEMLLTKASLALLMQHSLTGTGYGFFEGRLPEGLALAGLSGQLHAVVSRPGNELLYWLTEGGVVAGAGLLVLMAAAVCLLFRLWRQARREGGDGSDAPGWLLCILPVVLLSLVDTPWYQSPVHFLLTVLFTGLAVARLSEAETSVEPSRPIRVGLRVVFVLAGLAVVWFAVTATWVNMGVETARLSRGQDMQVLDTARQANPWVMRDEVHFALTVGQLQQFSRTHDAKILAATEPFFRDYLRRHPDPNVYSMYIRVLDFQGKQADAEQVYREAQGRVAWDPRFAPDTDDAGTDDGVPAGDKNE